MFREFGQAPVSMELDLDTFDGPWTHVAAFRGKAGWLMAAQATIQSEHDLLSAKLIVACDEQENPIPTWRAIHLTECNWSDLDHCDEAPPEILDELLCEAEGDFYARWQREMNGDLAQLFEQAQRDIEVVDARGRAKGRQLERNIADLRRQRRMVDASPETRMALGSTIADLEAEYDTLFADLATQRHALRRQADAAEEALWQRTDVLIEVEPLYIARWRTGALRPETRPIPVQREGRFYAPLVLRHDDCTLSPIRLPLRAMPSASNTSLPDEARRILAIVQQSLQQNAANSAMTGSCKEGKSEPESGGKPTDFEGVSRSTPGNCSVSGENSELPSHKEGQSERQDLAFLRPKHERKLITNLKKRVHNAERRVQSLGLVLEGLPAGSSRKQAVRYKHEAAFRELEFAKEKLTETVFDTLPSKPIANELDRAPPELSGAEAHAELDGERVGDRSPQPDLEAEAQVEAPVAEQLDAQPIAAPKLTGLNAIRLRVLERKRNEALLKMQNLSAELDVTPVGSSAFVQKMQQHGAIGRGLAQADRKLADLRAELGLASDTSTDDLSHPALDLKERDEPAKEGAEPLPSPPLGKVEAGPGPGHPASELMAKRRAIESRILNIQGLLDLQRPFTGHWFGFRKMLREAQAELEQVEVKLAPMGEAGVNTAANGVPPPSPSETASFPSNDDLTTQRETLMAELREVEVCLANVDGLPKRVTFYRARRDKLLSCIARLSMRIASEEQRRAT